MSNRCERGDGKRPSKNEYRKHTTAALFQLVVTYPPPEKNDDRDSLVNVKASHIPSSVSMLLPPKRHQREFSTSRWSCFEVCIPLLAVTGHDSIDGVHTERFACVKAPVNAISDMFSINDKTWPNIMSKPSIGPTIPMSVSQRLAFQLRFITCLNLKTLGGIDCLNVERPVTAHQAAISSTDRRRSDRACSKF